MQVQGQSQRTRPIHWYTLRPILLQGGPGFISKHFHALCTKSIKKLFVHSSVGSYDNQIFR